MSETPGTYYTGNSMSDTPETDEMVEQSFHRINFPTNPVPAEFARKLERERDEAMEALERISHASMNARHKEEDYAEWEKAVFVLLDLCEERKVK